MRRPWIAFLLALSLVEGLAAGCSSGAPEKPPGGSPTPAASSGSGASASQDYTELDRYSGQVVTLTGTFYHERFKIGIIQLDSGLRVYMPHFDQFRAGDDWFKYVGKRCTASGILHTYTKKIEGYHHPTLEVKDFSGPGD